MIAVYSCLDYRWLSYCCQTEKSNPSIRYALPAIRYYTNQEAIFRSRRDLRDFASDGLLFFLLLGFVFAAEIIIGGSRNLRPPHSLFETKLWKSARLDVANCDFKNDKLSTSICYTLPAKRYYTNHDATFRSRRDLRDFA